MNGYQKTRVGLLEFLHKSGVHVLQDQKIEFERGGEKIQLLGMGLVPIG